VRACVCVVFQIFEEGGKSTTTGILLYWERVCVLEGSTLTE
jgi:hypothetical protein